MSDINGYVNFIHVKLRLIFQEKKEKGKDMIFTTTMEHCNKEKMTLY